MTTDQDKIHKLGLERFSHCESHWSSIYKDIEHDIDFLLGKNHWEGVPDWKDKVKLTINRVPTFVNSVVNDIRASRPAIRVSPIDDTADTDTAEVYQGLIRNIESLSDATSAYDLSAFFAASGGLGFLRVSTDYIEGTFDQEAVIECVTDVSTVYLDPESKETDGSDARYGFVFVDMPKAEFEKKYPGYSCDDFPAESTDWSDEEKVRVAEYFYLEEEEIEIFLLPTGEIVTKEFIPEGVEPENSRKDTVTSVKWCKITGKDILEETEWIGKHIPIVPVYGNVVYNAGHRNVFGLVRDLTDAQKMKNYWESAVTEQIALQPKSPYIMAEGQEQGHEQDWKEANIRNRPVLRYKPVDVNGQLAPPPQRQAPPQVSGAMLNMIAQSDENMKGVTGIYDASLGAQGNETSGRAIMARQRQGDISTFHYIDNLSKSIGQIGRILIDIIPRIYSGSRIVRILGEDGEQSRVPVNMPFIEQQGEKVPAESTVNFDGIYELDAGKYDVDVSVGPSYASKRQEGLEAMLEIAKFAPQIMGVAPDLIFKAMDTPYSDDIAERFKKTLPPELRDEENPEAAALKQAGQMIQAMEAKLAQMGEALKDKSGSEQAKREIEIQKIELEREKLRIQTAIDEQKLQIELLKAQSDALPPEAFQEIVMAIHGLDEKIEDASGALEILLSEDEGDTLPPIQ